MLIGRLENEPLRLRLLTDGRGDGTGEILVFPKLDGVAVAEELEDFDS